MSDPLEPFRDLRAERDRRNDAAFICEGAICIRRALESPRFEVQTLLATATQIAALGALVDRCHDVIEATNEMLHDIAGFKFHRGCLATVKKPVVAPPSFAHLGERSLVVFAESVSNPSNMGALVRNCRSFGVDLLVYTHSSADPFSRHAVRASMGNVFSLELGAVADLSATLSAFRQRFSAHVFAATLGENARPLKEAPRAAHMGVVLGTENTGLLPNTIKAAGHEITIPMAKGADSLNVAAASAVLLYELSTP